MTKIYYWLFLLLPLINAPHAFAAGTDSATVVVKKTTDFEVTGEGNSSHWAATGWITLPAQELAENASDLDTKAKILYSDKGIYFLISCQDQKLTASVTEDFGPLFKEDVVEVFLWPDQSVPIYLEYEVSPLNYELPILVPNINGKFQGWKPWNYEGSKRTRHATSTQGGVKESNAAIKGWTAEFFIPFSLLSPLVQQPVRPGTRWRANMYRIDYDHGYSSWTWQKTEAKVRGSFHQFNKFGTLLFE